MIGSRDRVFDLIIVGAGPTGIAIGCAAKRASLDLLLVDRGPLVANLLQFPTYMTFFTTRDLLEVAGVPFAIPEDKPDRRQAVAYYHSVVRRFGLPLALHEEVIAAHQTANGFEVVSEALNRESRRRSRAVALATGYFHLPRKLSVPGEELPWVHSRYVEPYRHFGERIVVVGGGNSAAEAALDLWRNGAAVTLVHRGEQLKSSVKYWLKPDFEHRVAEGSIAVRFRSRVTSFSARGVELEGSEGEEILAAEAAYVLIGYAPDAELQRRCGIDVDCETLVPSVDEASCESNVPGLYVAGTLLAGRRTDQIFIENSRDHGERIVRHLAARLAGEASAAS